MSSAASITPFNNLLQQRPRRFLLTTSKIIRRYAFAVLSRHVTVKETKTRKKKKVMSIVSNEELFLQHSSLLIKRRQLAYTLKSK
jgi:hypothetical protein